MKGPVSDHECERCGEPFEGSKKARYCKKCRYIVSHLRNHHIVKGEKVPVEKTEPAHCQRGKDYLASELEARGYARVNGKIYKYCPECEWKRGQHNPEEHRVIW